MKAVRKSTSLIAAAVLAASLAWPAGSTAAAAAADAKKIPAAIQTLATPAAQDAPFNRGAEIVPGEVIVKYKDGGAPKGISASSLRSLGVPGAVQLKLEEGKDVYAAIAELEADPNVEYAQPVYVYHALEVGGSVVGAGRTVASSVYSSDDPLNPYQWGLYALYAHNAWADVPVAERKNIVVAVLDSGVRTDHEDLAGQFLTDGNGKIVGANFISDDANDYQDYYGHGTSVAGIIGAAADNGIGIAGIASGVRIMPVRVLDSNGYGTTETVANGIRFAVDNGADVINMSLGGEDPDPTLQSAIEYAQDRGVVLVAATGNESLDTVDYPAAYPGVIGVGAVEWRNDNEDYYIDIPDELPIADFSNTGAEVDVVAPGVQIVSTYFDPDSQSNGYANGEGTSFSTPFVSGVAALILAHDSHTRALTGAARGEEVQRILEDCAYDLGAPGKDEVYGAGLIQAGFSVAMPRIGMSWTQDASGNLSMNLQLFAANGNPLTDSGYPIRLTAERWESNQFVFVRQDDLSTIDGSISHSYSDLNEPGIYRFTADDGGSTNELIYQDVVLELPAAPVASPGSGTYGGARTVTLTTATIGAKIYYTLDGSNPTPLSTKYSGPITIGSNTTLKAIAVKNAVTSKISTYTYTIEPAGGSGGGGGGGGGFFLPPSDGKNESTDKDGKSVLEVAVDNSEALKAVESDSTKEVVIDAQSDADPDKLAVGMSGEIVQKASERGKPIRIKSNRFTLSIPPGSIKVTDPKAEVKWTAEALDDGHGNTSELPPSRHLVSRPYDFALQIGGNRVTSFDKPVTVTFSKLASVNDREKLGVYYYNEQTKSWDYAGGYAKGSDAITFTTSHFSIYAVMESNVTFDDIASHWAKHDIEVMAARQVAQGRGPDTFDPNGTVSRAEFAALLTRALALGGVSQVPFADVPESAWYHDAVSRAYAAGIISGTSDTTFAPNAPVSREAMATMLLNAYAYAAKVDLGSLVTTQEVKYTDEGTISAWARRNVRLANALGLMVGTDGKFRPQAVATRAESVSILKRLIDKLNE